MTPKRFVTDAASQHLTTGLELLRQTEKRVRSIGHALYLETKAKVWTRPRGLSFCKIGNAPSKPAIILGFAIHCDDGTERAVVFSITVSWDDDHWSVQSFVEDEDCTRDVITKGLWESPDFQGSTLDEFVGLLKQAADALMMSTQDQKVAAKLATIARRA